MTVRISMTKPAFRLTRPMLSDGLSKTWDEAVSALLPQLEACIADPASSPSDELALQRRLLAVLSPSDWAALPAARSAGSVESTARYKSFVLHARLLECASAFYAASRTCMRARCGPRSLRL